MDIILQIFWVNILLFIWFETDAFIEYIKILKLDIFKVKQFEEYKLINPKISYHSYIRQKHASFFTRLLTCVPCMCFWIVVVICLMFNSFYFYPIIYISSYVLYKLLRKYVY